MFRLCFYCFSVFLQVNNTLETRDKHTLVSSAAQTQLTPLPLIAVPAPPRMRGDFFDCSKANYTTKAVCTSIQEYFRISNKHC